MVDTHCHLYDEAFDADRDEAVSRAVAAGVDMMLLPGIDSTSHSRQEALASSHPQYFRQMMGLHPTSVSESFEAELAIVHEKLFAPAADYVGVGEIGLDLYWDKTYLEQQREVLKRQMQWARELGLPVCLHVRKAYNELLPLPLWPLRCRWNVSYWRPTLHISPPCPIEANATRVPTSPSSPPR